jgi:predicted nucleic acid-binding protein
VRYLLDTSVVSETRKMERANRGVRTWISRVRGDELCISVLVLGEIRQGVERLRPRDPEQASVYEDWLAGLARVFEGRTLEITAGDAGVWGKMNAPDPLPAVDSLMAAQAVSRGITIVTGNPRDFERTGARVVDPFDRG